MKRGAEPYFAVGWIVFGAAVLAGSWRMDRLEGLHINPWSVPGLMPGVLGALMIVFGAALGVRALRQRVLQADANAASPQRVILAVVLCFGYAAGLLGHGLPFWLTSAAFIFIAILSFRWLDRDAETPTLARLAASSAAIAVGAAVTIGLLFEQVFLVRLP
jgi:hypothetical protein